MNAGALRPSDFRVGDRVQTHPATNAWISGDRYGDVVRVTSRSVHVHLDRSGRTRAFRDDLLLHVTR